MTPTATPEKILDNLKQRITDGDETVTAAELQQAETAVEFTRLQAEGQQARAAAAEHDAKIAELEQIRHAITHDVPNVTSELSKLTRQFETTAMKILTLTDQHNERITGYVSRVKALDKEGVTIDGLTRAAGDTGIIADNRIVSTHDAKTLLERILEQHTRYSGDTDDLHATIPRMDREHASKDRTIRWIEDRGERSGINPSTGLVETHYQHRAGDTTTLGAGQAKALVEVGVAEYAD